MGGLLLAVETSTRSSDVALVDADGALVERCSTTPDEGRPLAELVLACAGGRWPDVGAYAVGVGPGSFTGLRVGLALLKGIAAAHPRPVVPISSLAAWAQSLDDVEEARAASERWVVLDARRAQVWAGRYRVGADGLVAPAQADFRAALDDVRSAIGRSESAVVGTAAALALGEAGDVGDAPRRDTRDGRVSAVARDFASLVPSPSALHLARLAQSAQRRGAVVEVRQIAPNYLMPSAAEEKLAGAPIPPAGR